MTQPLPTASDWKASKYRLVGAPGSEEYVEAASDAKWAKVDPFRYYKPPLGQDRHGPHGYFAKLGDMAREWDSPRKPTEKLVSNLFNGVGVLACRYGLLGLFREAFAAPVLPARADHLTSWVAPDATIDRDGRLRSIDPRTEGKRLLEELLDKRRRSRRSGQRSPSTVELKYPTQPSELRFPVLSLDIGGGFGLIEPTNGWRRSGHARYDEVQERFGIRLLLDEGAQAGVSIISTREPVDLWIGALKGFYAAPPHPAYFDVPLEGVSPRAVAQRDGGLASSYRCPSLLKAIYLMLYLDEIAGVKLRKCQAPGCPEYYRVGLRSRESLYCPPLPGSKQSQCASRVSSQKYRDRKKANAS